MTCYRKTCQENHTGPVELTYPQNRIGAPWTGYACFTAFVAGGGYGVDQTVLDTIASTNATYQAQYDDLQAEADLIYAWFNTEFTIGSGGDFETMAAYEAAAAMQEGDWFAISAEVAALWRGYCNTLRALVGDTAYAAFLADQQG